MANRKRNGADTGAVAVIGLGRFGTSLALELSQQGNEVLGIDRDAKVVQALAGQLTHAVQADSTDEDAMRQLSVHELGHAVIGIGNNLEASILSASVLVTLGVRNVWAKAITAPHARILTQIGVHRVVRPEHDMGRRVAHLVSGRLLDYIELDDSYTIVKASPPGCICGVPLSESRPRDTYGVTVVGLKHAQGEFDHAEADTVIGSEDVIIVAGSRSEVESFAQLS